MEKFKAFLKIVGGLIMVVAAAFGVTDFGLDPRLAQYATYFAYLLLFLLGGAQMSRSYRAFKQAR